MVRARVHHQGVSLDGVHMVDEPITLERALTSMWGQGIGAEIMERKKFGPRRARGLSGAESVVPEAALRVIRTVPWIAGIPARLIDIGRLPERIPRWAKRPSPAPVVGRARGPEAQSRPNSRR